jgi:UDP-N-acetylmuramoylalanine--D-glutamate ligase
MIDTKPFVQTLDGKPVAVLGLGLSGLASAKALMAGGAQIVGWDDSEETRAHAENEGVSLFDFVYGGLDGYAALVMAPGIPLHYPQPHEAADKARASRVPIIGDLEILYRSHHGRKTIGITGTNGKSTTTALIDHILNASKRHAVIGGNIGKPVLSLDLHNADDTLVLEISSYQMDLCSTFRPDIAVLLNITPDHLDRHGGMEGYIAAKRRVFLNQDKGDTAVIGVDDAYCQRICTEIMAANRRTIWPISAGKAMGRGVYVLSGMLYDGTGERVLEVADLLRAKSLPGRHNWQNAAAAYAAARGLGISAADAAEGLMTFPGLAHRMETVAMLGRVRLVNDSKATNADAARQALASYPKVRWIAGGVPKAGGIESLTDLFPRVASAYLIGEAAGEFAKTLDGHAPVRMCGTMHAAVEAAYADAVASGEDEVVLLSPACASFDQYPDFEVRGDDFRAVVQSLSARDPAAQGVTA